MPPPRTTPTDPYDVTPLRERVLAAWAASPARFREDANAEEDLALGGYRDRLVVELAQNAADAAARAGVEGRLLLSLADGVLTAANTGQPLDADGVEALSTLRASAKRDDADSVGRFGVGFAAVLAVTDTPRIDSGGAAVQWSRQATRDAVASIPALADELRRRGGHVPVLRLPTAVPPARTPAGYATTVTLPLRDAAAAQLARRLLAEVDDTLLLALPGLRRIDIEVDGARRQLADVDERWTTVRREGSLDARLLADRPTEDRARTRWSLTWARPRQGSAEGRPVVHAPTPTDEPLDLPARLLATFPLDPSRRHVAPGPATDFLVDRCAEAYAELVTQHPDPLLVPGPVPVGVVDGALRRAIRERLPETPFLPAAADPQTRLRPRDAVSVTDAGDDLIALLADVIPGLLARPWSGLRQLEALGTRRLHLADVVDALSGLEREPSFWRGLYAALAGTDRDALGALPVPLADGRTVRGPRGLLLPGDDLAGSHVEALRLRLVHPDAAHPLLERLGATPVTARGVLDQLVAESVLDDAWDSPEGEDNPISDAVLTLVRAAGLRPGELPWLGDLPLPDPDGEPTAARDLVLPGSLLAALVTDPVAPHPDLVRRWAPDVLTAAGVGAGFVVERDVDVVADDDCDHDLPDEDRWIDELRASAGPGGYPPVLSELVGVRDLDLVRADAWPDALAALAADKDLRAAVVEPARVVAGSGARTDVASYTAWWLRRHARIGGRPLTSLRTREDPTLEGIYDDVDLAVDAELLRAVGVRTTLPALLAEPGGADDLLDRLADPERTLGATQLRALYAALAAVDPTAVAAPERVRVPDGEGTRVVAADDVEVVDGAQWLQLPAAGHRLVLPLGIAAPLADVLDVALASDADVAVTSTGRPDGVPAVLATLLPSAPPTWLHHDPLVVGGHEVGWWVDAAGPHASSTDGLARALAWQSGDWSRRHLLAALLAATRDAGETARLLAEAELD